VLGLLAWLWAMFVLAWHTLVDAVLFAATSTFLKATKTPIEGVDRVEFHQKRMVHRTLSLDDIKVVKYAVGSVSFFIRHVLDQPSKCTYFLGLLNSDTTLLLLDIDIAMALKTIL